jgi:hypothetical protein
MCVRGNILGLGGEVNAAIYSEPGVAGSAVIVDGYSAGLLLPYQLLADWTRKH